MRSVVVDLGQRSYPITIGVGLTDRQDPLLRYVGARQVAIVTNNVIAPLYLSRVSRLFTTAGKAVAEIVLPDGEAHKTWQTLNTVYDALLANRCERSVTLVALGGGVIGDLTGFAAATYQRGADFIQIPTTLLAQVDSSVGGKTGINHPLGKNMIGAFHQPRLVLIDTNTLATLPMRELSAGLSEVIKYGLIRDLEFFGWLEENIESLVDRHPAALERAIERSCANKAEVVAADETEAGLRAILNLGHTFGHAIEAGLGYGVWLHGEAVAAGMVMAASLSWRLGWLQASDVERIRALLRRAKLPVDGPRLGSDRYLELMRLDKKVANGKLRLVLLQRLGSARIASDVPLAEIRAVIDACCHDA